MRVRLNLATKPLATHRRFLVASATIACVSGIVFLTLGWHVYAARRAQEKILKRMEEIRVETGDLETRRAKLEKFFAQPENAKLSERAAFVNTIIDESSFLWTQMFMDLERVKPAGVRLLSISPKMVKGNMEVKLKVGANSDDSKLKFLRALEGSKAFGKVVLLSDQVATQPGEDRQVFELTVAYTGA